jgi:aminoglycoside 6-adenylyltransferase
MIDKRLDEVRLKRIAAGYERLVERFVAWAENEEPIRAAAVIGSRARTDHPADEFADLDIVVFTTSPERYADRDEWAKGIGNVVLSARDQTPEGGEQERRMLYEDGLGVDFALMPLAWLTGPADPSRMAIVRAVVGRGIRVILDKDNLIAGLPQSSAPPASFEPPGREEFLDVVNGFWYHAIWAAKHLRRGELWWAKSCVDGRLKASLLKMLEWHARESPGAGHDTWFRGRFLEEWADPRALRELVGAFAYYDKNDVWRALFETMKLFRWVARETAGRLRHDYSVAGEREATRLIEELYRLRGG